MAKSRRFELRYWLVAMASAAATSAGSSSFVAASTFSSCMTPQVDQFCTKRDSRVYGHHRDPRVRFQRVPGDHIGRDDPPRARDGRFTRSPVRTVLK